MFVEQALGHPLWAEAGRSRNGAVLGNFDREVRTRRSSAMHSSDPEHGHRFFVDTLGWH